MKFHLKKNFTNRKKINKQRLPNAEGWKFNVIEAEVHAGYFSDSNDYEAASGDPVSADVFVNEDSPFSVWQKDRLQKLFPKNVLYKPCIYSLCSMDVAKKLRQISKTVTTA